MMPIPVDEKIPVTRAIIPTRVLVVDSEPLIRWSICAALTAQGFDTVSASDAAEASRLAHDWPPHVVIVDVRQPDCGETDLVTWSALFPECRFLILTTEPRAAAMAAANANGIEVIEKPFDLDGIVERVTRLATMIPRLPADALSPTGKHMPVTSGV